MSVALDGPIPGQSLTAEPGNALYERPPEIDTPSEALMAHIEKLNDPRAMKEISSQPAKHLIFPDLYKGHKR